jgi:hypothetical protein
MTLEEMLTRAEVVRRATAGAFLPLPLPPGENGESAEQAVSESSSGSDSDDAAPPMPAAPQTVLRSSGIIKGGPNKAKAKASAPAKGKARLSAGLGAASRAPPQLLPKSAPLAGAVDLEAAAKMDAGSTAGHAKSAKSARSASSPSAPLAFADDLSRAQSYVDAIDMYAILSGQSGEGSKVHQARQFHARLNEGPTSITAFRHD